jgi:flavin-dependent dehydrogenase
MYDVIVVGARCAGSATAVLLARKGFKVLILDKARFPSEIPQGHFIRLRGPKLLRNWGILDDIVRSGCPPVTKMTMDLGDFPLTGTSLVHDGIALGYGPRRSVLDAILIEAAIAAGAEFRAGVSVDDYLSDGAEVTGICGRNYATGAIGTERARITVGADGRHSSLARAVGAPAYEEIAPLACWYFSYWGEVALDGLEIYRRDRSVVFAFPTNAGLTAIFIGWPISEFGRVRQNVAAAFMDVFEQIPQLEKRVCAGRQVERFYGTADVPNFFRKPFGPGWALVGDAGYHKDPYMALGISDALHDAELLAGAIDEGFSGRRTMLDAMTRYEQQRNEASMPLYRQNAQQARFQPVPEKELAIRAAIRGDQEATRALYLVQQGMIPRDESFNPANLQQLSEGIGAETAPF